MRSPAPHVPRPTRTRSHRLGRVAASVAVGAIALSGVGAPAVASPDADRWSQPERLTKLDSYFHDVRGAVGSDGTAAVIFDRGKDPSRKVQTRVRSAATGEWGRRQLLVRTYASEPIVAAERGGMVAAAWLDLEDERLVVRRHDGDGWGRRHRLDLADLFEVNDIAINARGDVAVVMQQRGTYDLAVATLAADGRWTVPSQLASSEWLVPRHVLLSDDGHLTVVATVENTSDTDTAVVVGRLSETGAWDTARLGPPEDARVSDVAAAMGPDGTTAIVWTESDWYVRWQRVVRAVADPGGAFDRVVLDGSPERSCPYPVSCAGVGFSADNRLVLVWSTGGAGSGVLAAERSADGMWSDPVAVPLAVQAARVVHVDVAPDGATVIAATALDADDDLVSCPTLSTCTSIGVPRGWAELRRYSWVEAGRGGKAYVIHGTRLCDGRCFGRPYWSSWRPR